MRALGKKFLLFNVIFLVTALVCFVYMFFNAGNRDGYFFIAAIGLAGGIIGCLSLDRFLIRSIICPSCGTKLMRAKPPRGKIISIQYHCEKCNVIWDTDAPQGGHIEYSDPL